ncbi:1-hydroxycarotenoid 3,4-desaturase CrtD [Eisenibacter elegans]|uniref:1-hydroxycarotenoid 3,4-desaturase CrtD n=1 Tax=Eisenibacter elegans TaxID=997 RepID=UPI00040253F0|nr:1-hydroxycarotenoid 3,4-desaturase CrtD [Eisenibacter elegans]
MNTRAKQTCAVIGAGPAGLASAIRMANKGYQVTVFEANAHAGGKLSQSETNGYRFDMGPSVFTMPSFVDELYRISGKNPRDYYDYQPLDPVYRYFYEDGTHIVAYKSPERFAEEVATKTTENKDKILAYLQDVAYKYNLTADIFLHNSLHKVKNYLTKRVARGLWNFGKLEAFRTMDTANKHHFKDPRVVQLFNRYATYNGSNPYEAPATLNVIPHLEINLGAYLPHGGMYSITKGLVRLAEDLGVEFRFETKVEEIVLQQGRATGIRAKGETEAFDCVISNMDVYNTYKHLLPKAKKPQRTLSQPKSSSAIIFYWGIKHSFEQLGLHNIFFSDNYPAEFDHIFHKKQLYNDPTIYLNITSKYAKEDAPEGCENWFTMINAPHNDGQDNWDEMIAQTRENLIAKLSRHLKTDIRPLIECELIWEPRKIEALTSSAFGAIYGNSSNNKFAAFLRHANFSSSIKNLYFCGGSVHPGPSIPLCMLSAKITTDLIAPAVAAKG